MKGILFRPEMIKAIREGRKTVTRRLLKLNIGFGQEVPNPTVSDEQFKENIRILGMTGRYHPGEVVYIKEGLGREQAIGIFGNPIPKLEQAYFLSDHAPVVERLGFDLVPWWKGKTLSPLFLSAYVARTFLKIVSVRPERLQEISRDDIRAEGLLLPPAPRFTPNKFSELHQEYAALWDSINKDFPWASNPFVWRIEFTPTERPAEE